MSQIIFKNKLNLKNESNLYILNDLNEFVKIDITVFLTVL
jgi:hypothetical protein